MRRDRLSGRAPGWRLTEIRWSRSAAGSRAGLAATFAGAVVRSMRAPRILILEPGGSRRSRRSEPGGQRFRESELGSVSDPGNVSVGPDQHGSGSGDRAKYRKLPRTDIFSIDQLDPVSPWSDVKAAGLTEVEQHRPGVVQQGEDPQRAVGGHEVQIGHTAPEQGVALTEVVMNVQPGDDPGEPFARLVHARQLRHHIDEGLDALVPALERGLSHRVLKRAGS